MYLSSGVMMDKILRMILLWPFAGVVTVSQSPDVVPTQSFPAGEEGGEVEEGKESGVDGGPGRSSNATPMS